MKKCSTSLDIKEIVIKATWRFHLTLIKMATIKEQNSKYGKDTGVRNPYILLLGMYIGRTTVESSVEAPKKTEN
jgi:hypothetical protein